MASTLGKSMLWDWREARRIRALPRVATIATMPSRLGTFPTVVARLLPQVDTLLVFLDNFDATPEFLLADKKIVVARSQDVGDLHCHGRLLPVKHLARPSVVVVVDDDIEYPRNYVSRLVNRLAAASGRAVVGVHGRVFKPPYQSYIRDVKGYHFGRALLWERVVDELGTGTCAFLSNVLDFDVREWRNPDESDLQLAFEAKKRGLALICVRRRKRWLRPYAEGQADSLWTKTVKDPSAKSALMRILMSEAIARLPRPAGSAAPETRS